MSWNIESIARLLTEDPDVSASPEATAIRNSAAKIGGNDPASTNNVRKQMETQRKLQQQQRQNDQKKLDPFFDKLGDAESDIDTLSTTLQNQHDSEQDTISQLGAKGPMIKQAANGIRGNLPQ